MSSDDYEFNDEDEDEVLPTYQEYLDFDLSEDEELHRNLNNHGVSVTSYAQNQSNGMNAPTENGQHMRSLSATTVGPILKLPVFFKFIKFLGNSDALKTDLIVLHPI